MLYLFPWLASISESEGFIGYFRGDYDDYPVLIRFLNGRAGVYKLKPLNSVHGEINDSKHTLSLDITSISELVGEELRRQAECLDMSLEAYAASVVAEVYVDEDVLLEIEQVPPV